MNIASFDRVKKRKIDKIQQDMKARGYTFSRVEIYNLLLIFQRGKELTKKRRERRAFIAPKSQSSGIGAYLFKFIMHRAFDINDDYILKRLLAVFSKGAEVSDKQEPTSSSLVDFPDMGPRRRARRREETQDVKQSKRRDLNEAKMVSEAAWFHCLAPFLKGSLEQQAKFVFDVYDENGDGDLSIYEIMLLLRSALIGCTFEDEENLSERPIDTFVGYMVKHLRDSLGLSEKDQLTGQDYVLYVQKNPIMVCAFGNCLPSETSLAKFLSSIQNQIDSSHYLLSAMTTETGVGYSHSDVLMELYKPK